VQDGELSVAQPRAAHLWRPSRTWPSTAVFLALCALAFVLRFVALTGHHAPPTIDAGNWLAYGHALLGEHIRSSTIVYPPLVPLLVSGATWLFGATTGVSLVAAACAVAPGLGAFVTARSAAGRWVSTLVGGLLLFVASTGEAAAWGGFPQLIGLGLLPLFVLAVDRWLRTALPSRAVVAGALLMCIAATSDIITGAAVVSAGAVVALRFTVCRTRSDSPVSLTVWVRGLLGLLVPCITFVPLYMRLVEAVFTSRGSEPSGARFALSDLPSHVDFLYRDFTSFWRAALIVTVLTPIFLADRRRQPLWVVSTSLVCSSAAIAVVLREDRFLYILPTAIVLALATWFEELARHRDRFFARVRTGCFVVLIAALGVQVVTGMRLFGAQRRYYMILDPGIVSAIRWVDRNTPRSALVAVPPIRNAPAGWWIEGLGHRESLLGSPLEWLNYPDERRRALLANAIFSQQFPDTSTLALAAHDGVSLLLLPRSSDVLDFDQIDRFIRDHPSAVAFKDSTTVVLRAQNG
jgi:hypothetical protein